MKSQIEWAEVKKFAKDHNILVMKTSNENSYEIHSYWDNVEMYNLNDNPEEAMNIVKDIIRERSERFKAKNNMWGS